MIKTPLLGLLIASLLLAACAKDEYGRDRPLTRAETGAIVGAVSGAAVGAAVDKKNRGKGALIGAIGGGLTGAAIGAYMDKQHKDLNKVLAPETKSGAVKIETLPNHVLKLIMTANTSFDSGSAQIKPGFHSTLDKIADVLNRYGKTELHVVGHTDSVGSDASNLALSKQRAQAVNQYLLGHNVHPARLSSDGLGESQPRASNTTADGRSANRRVEIFITPVEAS